MQLILLNSYTLQIVSDPFHRQQLPLLVVKLPQSLDTLNIVSKTLLYVMHAGFGNILFQIIISSSVILKIYHYTTLKDGSFCFLFIHSYILLSELGCAIVQTIGFKHLSLHLFFYRKEWNLKLLFGWLVVPTAFIFIFYLNSKRQKTVGKWPQR